MGWADGPVLGFDTETTGVDVRNDRVVSAALVGRHGEVSVVQTWLIDPGVAIPAAATAIHGITTKAVREHGAPAAVALEELAGQLAAAFRAGVPVVAYNAAFDLTLLEHDLRRHGLRTLHDRLGGRLVPVIDPLVLDRAEDPYRSGPRKLVDLCGHYRVGGTDGLHAADADVLATLDVLAELVRRYPHLAALDTQALHAYQVQAHQRWAQSFNAWRSRRGLAGPGARIVWPCDPADLAPPEAAATLALALTAAAATADQEGMDAAHEPAAHGISSAI